MDIRLHPEAIVAAAKAQVAQGDEGHFQGRLSHRGNLHAIRS